MNILFISYWGISDGLTVSTVIPHVEILSGCESVNKIILITIERNKIQIRQNITGKTIHVPLKSKSASLRTFGQILDFMYIPRLLKKHCRDFRIDKIIARGVLAGTLAYKTSKQTGIPFYVESFEPHADYMGDAGVWKRYGLKYAMQKRWESMQMQAASGLITVSQNYKKHLESLLIEKAFIFSAPCAVDIPKFKYEALKGSSLRKKFGFDHHDAVGIYVGKFGGLYLEVKDLHFLNEIKKYFHKLGVIILTPSRSRDLVKEIEQVLDPEIKVVIRNEPHHEVPHYLSAADFALSLIKPISSGKYNSPVKHGEYWANGLPILMTPGIGDESEFLEKERGGVFLNMDNPGESLKKLQELMSDPQHRKNIPEIARKYRSFDKVREAYESLILSDSC